MGLGGEGGGGRNNGGAFIGVGLERGNNHGAYIWENLIILVKRNYQKYSYQTSCKQMKPLLKYDCYVLTPQALCTQWKQVNFQS